MADEGAGGCADPPIGSLAGAGGIAISPGGGDVYVASGLSRSVTRLSRSPSGAIAFGSCTANDGRAGCADPGHDSLVGAGGIAVAPGGEDLYVTSFDGGAVSHLRRGADGSLSVADCVADEGNFGCADTPGSVIEGPTAIAIAPRGRDVYVTSLASGSISQFRRARSGRLSFRRCWADGGANGCKKVPVASLLGATGVAIGSDGKSVYVASQIGVVSRFERSPRSGTLRFGSCVGSDGKGGCAEPRRDSLDLASGVAVSGRDVYVASQAAGSITRLRVNGRGRLRFFSCLAAGRANGCSGGVPAAALGGAYAIAVNDRALYLGASRPGAVSAFSIPKDRQR